VETRRWQITFGGHTWTDADATTGHVVALGEMGLSDWKAVSPWSSPVMLAAWLTVLIASTTGAGLPEAEMRVGQIPLNDLVACLSEPSAAPDPEPVPES